MANNRLPEAPGTPLRALIDRSYTYMKLRDDQIWEGAEGLVREAFRLGQQAAEARAERAGAVVKTVRAFLAAWDDPPQWGTNGQPAETALRAALESYDAQSNEKGDDRG